MTKKTVFFPNLDGLRFLAFASVFFAHTFFSTHSYIETNEFYLAFRFLGKHGALGVNFFFVLSGFLITYLLLEERKSTNRINIGNFYVRRILRIWPLYYVVVFIGYALFPLFQNYFGKEIEESNLIYYLLFVSNYNPEPAQSAILGILWSIAVEEQFYVLWPVIVAVIPEKKLHLTFSFIVISSFMFRTFLLENVYENSLACMSDLTIGSWAAFLVFDKKDLKLHFERLSKSAIVTTYVIGLLVIFLKDIWKEIQFLHNNERLVFSFFFAFIILEQNYAKNSFFKMSKYKAMSRLGKYTYGLYMLHFVAIYIVYKILSLLSLNDTVIQVLVLEPILAMTLSIVLAYSSFHILEEPFLRIKRKFAKIVKD